MTQPGMIGSVLAAKVRTGTVRRSCLCCGRLKLASVELMLAPPPPPPLLLLLLPLPPLPLPLLLQVGVMTITSSTTSPFATTSPISRSPAPMPGDFRQRTAAPRPTRVVSAVRGQALGIVTLLSMAGAS
jgi:hypothetical protein